MKRIPNFPTACLLVAGLGLAAPVGAQTVAPAPAEESPAAPVPSDYPEYVAIQSRLQSGWNTWDSRSVIRFVHLPEAMAINLAFKRHAWLEEEYLPSALIGRRADGAETVRPGLHSYDGSYSELTLEWNGLAVRVEAATDGDDLVVLVTPERTPEPGVRMVVDIRMLWNRGGTLERQGRLLVGRLEGRAVSVQTTAEPSEDPFVPVGTPYLTFLLGAEPIGIFTGAERSVGRIRALVRDARERFEEEAKPFGELAEAYLAVQSGVAWNTIYEPRHGRVVSTVGRLWNEEYGGYALFGWDNFFLAYLTSLTDPELGAANVIEHLRGLTDGGFIPNDNRGNGSKSWDRSQPPVGSIMVREVYRRYPHRWFAGAAFEALLSWNRWWPATRLNDGLLSYGSHLAKNPFLEPSVQTKRTAGYESGMDDSPMYEGVPFNREKNTLELQDVGLTSLYIADCLALADLARVIGRTEEERELRLRAAQFTSRLDALWDDQNGYYLNFRTDLSQPSFRRSPTLFYPMLARVPDEARARRLVEAHLMNPDEFWGPFVLPSTTRDDPSFPRQRYWKGAIWPPLNFLTYLSLRQYGFEEVRSELAEKSLDMFVSEWRRQGYVSENYSAITGTGDADNLSSDPFHSWGALFGILAFIEAGYLAGPETDL